MHESIALCEQAKNRWGMGTAYRYLGLELPPKVDSCRHTRIYSKAWKSLANSPWMGYRPIAGLSGGCQFITLVATLRPKNYIDALQISIEAQAILIALDALLGLAYLQEQIGKPQQALLLCYTFSHASSEEETKTAPNRCEQHWNHS